jgi:serine/threonine-protein kinase
VAEDKKTQLGPPGRTQRPTGGQVVASATGTPAPVVKATPAPGHSTSYLPEQPDPLLGKTVADRYLIVRKLGEGGMGSVYLATHTILEKQVALKVLHGEFARKPDLVERFIQEAKAASRIRHENVIDISDFGTTPEGQVFFAMELLQGHDLHDEVTRAKMSGRLLPWSRSKKIFLQICAALSAAHAKGIVHRDLKPENVYLVDFLGDPDFVKLLDFGIAKLAEGEGAEGGRKLTKTGMLFGTPEYMSPEQARGEQVDHRVDIYAMGCILFQLVTGKVPFAADNFMGVLSMHLTEQPPTVAPETLDSIGAPRAIADVIDRALEKDRNTRWQTIDEFAAAIREVCGDPPPADRSQPMRAASVPAPATTTRAKPPTGVVQPIRSRPATVDQSSRIKTQWTGNLSIPEEVVAPAPQSKSKLPLIVGVAVVVIGGGIAAFALSRGHGSSGGDQIASGATPGSATPGSAAIAAPPPPPPPPPPEPKLPDMVALTLDSSPHGATVTDIVTGKVIGKTPLVVHTPGSKTPKQYQFHLHGYGDTTVELPLTKETLGYTETLQKGATGAAPVVHKVVDETLKTVPDLAVTHPDTGSAAAVTHPDTGSAAAVKPPDVPKPPDTGPAAAVKPPDPPKPPDTGSATKPPDQDCDEVPCLKGFGSNK